MDSTFFFFIFFSLLPNQPSTTMFAVITVTVFLGLVSWICLALKPPPPKICGSPGGPPVTSPRVKLSDGRHLAYKEIGISKQVAKNKIIIVHGFATTKDGYLPISKELIEELQLYILKFDRAGYGESDPNPLRSVKSDVLDIQELADKLEIGYKFHVMGISMGAYPIWGCLKYIPQRLSGAALVVPMYSYFWPCFPPNLTKKAFKILPIQFQWTFRVAYFAPWLFYGWMSQKLFPSLSIFNASYYSKWDIEITKSQQISNSAPEKIRQQGDHESIHRDILVGYGKWEFDPLDIEDPFPNKDGKVHLWQGREDKLIYYEMTRFLSERLAWIQYHEDPDAGHLMTLDPIRLENILRQLVKEPRLVSSTIYHE